MKTVVAVVAGVVGAVGVALASCADDSAAPDAGDAAVDIRGPRDAALAADATSPDAAAERDGSFPLIDTCGDGGPMPGAWVSDPHLCVSVFAEPLLNARQMAFAPNGDLFVEAGGQLVVLFDANQDGVIGGGESSIYAAPDVGLTHGVAFSSDGAFVYSSSESTVFRWSYTRGDRVATGSPEVVVRDLPVGGNHFSRTLVFDAQGRLYVNVGSQGDVDSDPALNAVRGQVRRFAALKSLADGGIAYEAGEAFALGLRNEVGLTFDSQGRMWGVENGSDGQYQSVASDVFLDNPADKLNWLDAPGSRFYGYPHCWTEFGFDGGAGRGTQWAYESPVPMTNEWCRDPKNVQPVAAALQGHWAPLGVIEYAGASLPWKGDLLITSHGSSGRMPPVGRLIARAHLVGTTVVSVTPIVGHLVDGGLEQGTWDARPVDIQVGPDGVVYFSDDFGGRVFRVGYRP